MVIDLSRLVPVERMSGDGEEDSALLVRMQQEAATFLRDFAWCRRIREEYFGLGIGGVVAVFLFRIDPPPDVDEWLWVVVGDLPSAYLVTDEAPTPVAALDVYCSVMGEWVSAVRHGTSLEDVYAVKAPATAENADLLAKRIEFIRTQIIPAYG